jgi:hypothetical protein
MGSIADEALQLLKEQEQAWKSGFHELVQLEHEDKCSTLSQSRLEIRDPFQEFNACCKKYLGCTSTSKPLQLLLIDLEDKHCPEPIFLLAMHEWNEYKARLWAVHLRRIEGCSHQEPDFWRRFLQSLTLDNLFTIPMWAEHEDKLGGRHAFKVLVPDGYKLQLSQQRVGRLRALREHHQDLKNELERQQACIDLYVEQCQEHAYRHVCELLTTATHDGHVPTLNNLLDDAKRLAEDAKLDPGSRIIPRPTKEEFVAQVHKDVTKLRRLEDPEFVADLYQLLSFLQVRQAHFQKEIDTEIEKFERLCMHMPEMNQQYQDLNEAMVHVDWDDRLLVLFDKWLRLLGERLAKLQFPGASAIEKEALSHMIHNSLLYFEAERTKFESHRKQASHKRDDLADSVESWRVERAQSALRLDTYYHRLGLTKVLKDKQAQLVSQGTPDELLRFREIILRIVDSTKASPEDVMKFTSALNEDEDHRNSETEKKTRVFLGKEVARILDTLKRDVEQITRTLENMKLQVQVAVRAPVPPFAVGAKMRKERRMRMILALTNITTRGETVIRRYTDHRQQHGSNIYAPDSFQRACARMRRVFLAPERTVGESKFYWDHLVEIFEFIAECVVQEQLFQDLVEEFERRREKGPEPEPEPESVQENRGKAEAATEEEAAEEQVFDIVPHYD